MGRTLNTLPMSVGLAFVICGALAPFTTPLAVLVTIGVSFLRTVTIRQKLFCWLVTLGAVAATLEILRTFTRMGN